MFMSIEGTVIFLAYYSALYYRNYSLKATNMRSARKATIRSATKLPRDYGRFRVATKMCSIKQIFSKRKSHQVTVGPGRRIKLSLCLSRLRHRFLSSNEAIHGELMRKQISTRIFLRDYLVMGKRCQEPREKGKIDFHQHVIAIYLT